MSQTEQVLPDRAVVQVVAESIRDKPIQEEIKKRPKATGKKYCCPGWYTRMRYPGGNVISCEPEDWQLFVDDDKTSFFKRC